MAFVFVQHLDPSHKSLLGELLAKAVAMPVIQVTDSTTAQPNRVYVIPPNMDMTITDGVLRLGPRIEKRGLHMPIDAFLRSLACDQKNRAIGVILSGTASDGTAGMKAIKAEGGITFAQSEDSARHGGMPHSAIAAGVVDFVLPPKDIARKLAGVARHLPVLAQAPRDEGTLAEGPEALSRIFAALRHASGVDFSHYKQNTIKRRIKRRMVLQGLERLDDYCSRLDETPGEVEALYEDLLIDVTAFFRDPESFEALKSRAFHHILKSQPSGGPVRVWVPGCSTGEEAYSLAISLIDFFGEKSANVTIQIFATDVSDSAIETARAGVYRESHLLDLTPERRRRYFTKVDAGYQVSKTVRDVCVFAKQNLVKDPPFSRLDLISCRNVLIYLESTLQRQIMPIFHYALKPQGFLWLGKAETIGGFLDLFTPVDRKHHIYARKAIATRLNLNFIGKDCAGATVEPGRRVPETDPSVDVLQEVDRVVLSRYAPASVVVDDHMEILQFRGRTGAYLEPATGRASLNLLRMAREGLTIDLRAGIHKARTRGEPVRREGLVLDVDGQSTTIDLTVIPLKIGPTAKPFFLVTFEEGAVRGRGKGKGRKAPRKEAAGRHGDAEQLRRELTAARDYLQATIEEREATNEELQAANEEILSANEELQSTNEELETSKEELQSTNEELNTVNDELQNRNAEMSQTNNDLINVLDSVDIPIVILDPDLRIRRFTPMAEKLLNLIPSDQGRRITHIKPNISVPELERLLVEVIETVTSRELALQDDEGRWYSMRIRPYKTSDNRIDGAVLAFLDIDELKCSLQKLQASESLAQAIVGTVRDGLLVLDAELQIKRANRSFCEMFHVTSAETENSRLQDLGRGHWNIPSVLQELRTALADRTQIIDLEVSAEFPVIGPKTMLLSARCLESGGAPPDLLLLAIHDATQTKQAEQAVLEMSGRLLGLRDEERRRIALDLHDNTAQSLAALGMNLTLVDQLCERLPPKAREALDECRSLAQGCAHELHDLAALLHPPLLDELGLFSVVQGYAEAFTRRTGIQVVLEGSLEHGLLPRDTQTALFRVVQESLTNVQRHSGSTTAWIRFACTPSGLELVVRDKGCGISGFKYGAATVPRIGILGMRERVKQIRGHFEIASDSGGTTVSVRVPLPAHGS
jgi:two-component system CheB/CheR fusion protein